MNKRISVIKIVAVVSIAVIGIAAVAIAVLIFLNLRTTPSSARDDSRTELYSSLSDMADNSSVIVVGTVQRQKTVHDIDDTTAFTLVDVAVDSTEHGSLQNGTSAITVRLTGAVEDSLLADGTAYAMFLEASGLSGDLGDQYYVTGATAGLYEVSSDAQSLSRVDTASGDTLPETVTREDFTAAIS